MDTRIGVIGIVVEDMNQTSQINEALHQYAGIIVGRMGIPYHQKGISVISLIIDGDTDEIGGLTGKLGNIEGVNVKSALSKKVY